MTASYPSGKNFNLPVKILLAVSLVVGSAGCQKKAEVAETVSPPVEQASSPSAEKTKPAPSQQPSTEAVRPDLSQLNQALHIYTFQRKKKPASVAELVSAGYVKTLPALPPGKRLEISPGASEIIIVNQ